MGGLKLIGINLCENDRMAKPFNSQHRRGDGGEDGGRLSSRGKLKISIK